MQTGLCDKCGRPVPKENDAVFIEFLVTGDLEKLWDARSRHLLPTEYCKGSPSRAQYLPGQPRSDSHPYNPENEVKWRAAWAKAQK